MEKLGAIAERILLAASGLPDESLCRDCDRIDLGVPGTRDILEARDPTGRLLAMAGCRCARLASRATGEQRRRWVSSNLPDGRREKSFENFKPRPGTEDMVWAANELVQGRGPAVLVITGGTGSGKTHMLEAVGRHTFAKGGNVGYEVAAKLLERMRHTYREGSKEDLWEVLEEYHRRSLVLLDDLGMERHTDFAAEQLTRLVNGRLQSGRAMVVATNLLKDEMAEHLGDRLASRLYMTNPDLDEVRLVANSASDYREREREREIAK